MWPSAQVRWAVVVSLALHASLVAVLSELASPPGEREPPDAKRAYLLEVSAAEPHASATQKPRRQDVQPEPGGPTSTGSLQQEAPGRGGDGASQEPGALLFAFPSSLTLQDTELNNLRTSQAQRILTAPDRATQEQRRASPNAQDAVFLASGEDGHPERRQPRKSDAAPGASVGDVSSSKGGALARSPCAGECTDLSALGQADRQETDSRALSAQTGSERATAQTGIFRGQGTRRSAAARVDFGRPNVDRGPAATTARTLDARVRDEIDAELLAAQLQRSLVDSSVQRGARRAAGDGGSDMPGPGLDDAERGSGSRALPFAPGPGRTGVLDTSDARYVRWFVEQRARVQNELRFPTQRALEMDQGMSVYSIVVGRDGRLRGTPTLLRSSGFSDFDAAAVGAIERAAPFAPLPEALAPQLERLSLVIPVAFSNPMVE